jgi:hypothetical protein
LALHLGDVVVSVLRVQSYDIFLKPPNILLTFFNSKVNLEVNLEE